MTNLNTVTEIHGIGDGAQIAFEPSGERGTNLTLYLYNVALNNSAESIITNHLNERTNGKPGLDVNEDVAVTRDDGAKKPIMKLESHLRIWELLQAVSVQVMNSDSASV